MSAIVMSLFFTIFLILTPINCKLFCEDPTFGSALTYRDEVLLFRSDQYWTFRPRYNSVLQNARKIDVEGIDTIFMNSDQQIEYIFSENSYFLTKIEPKNDSTYKFVKLDPTDNIPNKWSISGGNLSEWFPQDMDDAILLGDNLLIFHGSSIRYTKVDNEWPNETEKTEIGFSGSLENVSKIDAIFEMPDKDTEPIDIVIISGLKYCRFNKNQINFSSITELNISCEWKDSKDATLFKCPNNTYTTTLTTLTKEESTKSSEVQHSTTEISTEFTIESTGIKSKNTSVALLLIAVFSVLILVIIGFVILIAFILKKFLDKSTQPVSSRRHTTTRIDTDSSSVATLDLKSESTTQSS